MSERHDDVFPFDANCSCKHEVHVTAVTSTASEANYPLAKVKLCLVLKNALCSHGYTCQIGTVDDDNVLLTLFKEQLEIERCARFGQAVGRVSYVRRPYSQQKNDLDQARHIDIRLHVCRMMGWSGVATVQSNKEVGQHVGCTNQAFTG